MAGIYLHIPFCWQACSYCDFYFVTHTQQREEFVEKLVREIESYGESRFTEEPVTTIYFGGGTPSLLSPEQLEDIFRALEATFRLDLEEVTLEMNPDDVSAGYLENLRELGINRASMGVQSFNPELLSFMNRAHSREEALQCLELLSRSGFQTYTVDLIYGNPGQTSDELAKDIDQLLVFNPMHVSAYSLTVEPGTRLGKQVQLGRLIPPEDDVVAAHFDLINEKLDWQGIHRYEVSNYSKSGHEAVHNSNYWRHENYLGLGPGAHSFWWDEQAARWENKPDLAHYLSKDMDQRNEERETLSSIQLAEERIMMGLRTREGISEEEINTRYEYYFGARQMEYLRKKQEEGKVRLGDAITLTDRGIKIADAIILDVLTLADS